MSTNVFLIWAPESAVPLTVLARTASDAEDTFAFWCGIHQPHWSMPPAKIEEVTEEWLADRPQLMQLVERPQEQGIPDAAVLFRDHRGWFAMDVTENPDRAIVPNEPTVRSFSVTTEFDASHGTEVMIFARDVSDALAMYLIYWEKFYGASRHPYVIEEFSRSTLTGDMEILRKQMESGVTGFAGWSPTKGWSIDPLDEVIGEE